jgi:hypothetical protein
VQGIWVAIIEHAKVWVGQLPCDLVDLGEGVVELIKERYEAFYDPWWVVAAQVTAYISCSLVASN